MGKAKMGPKGGVYVITKNGNKKYLKPDNFCGPSGGTSPMKFPVNTEKRCRTALSYARHAPKPCGIVKCALNKAKKAGWSCGSSTKKKCTCGCSIK
jgi:hypothetical protein